MKKKYTKAKLEIIPLKTEAVICASPQNNGATGTDVPKDPNDSTDWNNPFGSF